MRRIDFYKIKRGDNLGDPLLWNKIFEDIDLRIAGTEAGLVTVEEARDALVARGLTEIREQIDFLMVQETALAWALIENAKTSAQQSAATAGEHAGTAAGHAANAAASLTALGVTMADVTNTISGIRAHVAQPGFDLASGSYLLDDISSQFNGIKKVFDLRLFTVAKVPSSATQLIVHLGNSYQVPGTSYIVGGATIEFDQAPPAGLSSSIVLIQIDTSNFANAEAAAIAARNDAIDAKNSAASSATVAVTVLSDAEAVLETIEGKALEITATVEVVEGHAETATTAKKGAETARDQAVAASRNLAWSYTFDNGVADTNPGATRVRFNHSTIGLATQMFISTEAGEGNIAAVLGLWDASSSSIRGAVRIANPIDKENWVHLHITGGVTGTGGYRKVPISVIAAAGELVDGDLVLVDFVRSGDAGAGAVNSFKDRDGAVIPLSGDYLASQVTNDSGVSGENVSDALDALATATAAKLPLSGGSLTGALTLPASDPEDGAGLNLGQGGDPNEPANGDVWINGSKLHVRASGETIVLGGTGDLPSASQEDAEEGESTALMAWTPERVRQAASAYAKQGENTNLCDDISSGFDGVEDTFALEIGGIDAAPAGPASVFCVLGGVVQAPGLAFVLAGSSIVFAEAPASDLECSLRIINA